MLNLHFALVCVRVLAFALVSNLPIKLGAGLGVRRLGAGQVGRGVMGSSGPGRDNPGRITEASKTLNVQHTTGESHRLMAGLRQQVPHSKRHQAASS